MSDLEVVKSVSLSLNREGGQKEVSVTNGGSDQWTQQTSGVMSGLTMAQLNNLLGTYIKTVREMEDKVIIIIMCQLALQSIETSLG